MAPACAGSGGVEHLVGNAGHQRTAAGNRAQQCGGGRQQLLGIEAGDGDLGAQEFRIALTGCQAEKENIVWDYGKSYHTVFEAQKIAPAVVDDKPVDTMDGTRAALAYERLEKQAPEEKKQGSGGFEAFLQQK